MLSAVYLNTDVLVADLFTGPVIVDVIVGFEAYAVVVYPKYLPVRGD
jgi:hypothetical protein